MPDSRSNTRCPWPGDAWRELPERSGSAESTGTGTVAPSGSTRSRWLLELAPPPPSKKPKQPRPCAPQRHAMGDGYLEWLSDPANGMSVRLHGALLRCYEGVTRWGPQSVFCTPITTFAQLTAKALLKQRGLGTRSLMELRTLLLEKGLLTDIQKPTRKKRTLREAMARHRRCRCPYCKAAPCSR